MNPRSAIRQPASPARSAMDAMFAPSTVAVVGATERAGSVGRTVLWNLIRSPFGGTVFPVNPTRPNVLGVRAYPSLAACPDKVDLAVVCTPAASAPALMRECGDLGVKAAIIISAGFKEIGPEGAELERRVLGEVRRGGMRLIGPNCLGLMNPLNGLNATFANGIARAGKVGFISQSGALCTAILDWSYKANVGFSAFVSVGSMLDVGWGDLIDHLGNDPSTESIVIYMETIGDARAFLSAAREVALTKPIIVIKPGRTAAAARAAVSHTGSLTGSDEVLDAAFRRSGVLRVNSISELFDMAEVLGKQPHPKGNRLSIVTNAGGPGVLATDALIMTGGELTPISESTLAALDQFLPAAWSRSNPIDVLGDAGAERYAKTLEIAAKDPNSDGLLVILTPQAMTEATATAEALCPYAQSTGKPILASWMGGPAVAAGEAILDRANIPTFAHPDTAVRAFTYLWKYSEALSALYETPSLAPGDAADAPDRAAVAALIEAVRASGRTLLTESESKQILAAYRIPIVETRVAQTRAEAVKWAVSIGFPIVLKLHSEVITHKTDVDGVKLNLHTPDDVATAFDLIEKNVVAKVGATSPSGQQNFLGVTVQPMVALDGYEIILGSSIDPQFGPVLLFGSGGELVEVIKDRALALPPLNTTLARRMMDQTRIYTALKGIRGRPPVDLGALEQLLVRFSHLIAEQPRIRELDINPLMVSAERLVALDARIVLHPVDLADEQLPRTAIRPYPIQYVGDWTASDGVTYCMRPIRPEDEPLLVKFHQRLSERSVFMRYTKPLDYRERVAHERLSRICFVDYDRELALVAETRVEDVGAIVGVARLIKETGRTSGEFNVLVVDAYQKKGIGTELLRRLVEVAHDEQYTQITSSDVLPENEAILRIAEKLGFGSSKLADGRVRLGFRTSQSD